MISVQAPKSAQPTELLVAGPGRTDQCTDAECEQHDGCDLIRRVPAVAGSRPVGHEEGCTAVGSVPDGAAHRKQRDADRSTDEKERKDAARYRCPPALVGRLALHDVSVARGLDQRHLADADELRGG